MRNFFKLKTLLGLGLLASSLFFVDNSFSQVIIAAGAPSWKSAVASVANLPLSCNSGDARVVKSPASVYACFANAWSNVSGGGSGNSVLQADYGTTAALAANTFVAGGTPGIGDTITINANGVCPSLDGEVPVIPTRDLIKDEAGANAPHNGVYTITNLGSVSTQCVYTRSTDNNTSASMDPLSVAVSLGNVNANTNWDQSTNTPTIDTNNIVFVNGAPGPVTQAPAGVQVNFQIPWWNSVTKQLSKGISALVTDASGNLFAPFFSATTFYKVGGATPSTNTLLGVNAAGTANEYKSIVAGTAGTDFAVTHSANTVTLNLPAASATASGKVNTTTQTFAGAKTFNTVGTTFAASTTGAGSVVMTAGAEPTSPGTGPIWLDTATNNAFAWAINTLKLYPITRVFMQSATKTTASSTTATTLFGTGLGTLTIPANTLKVGKTIRFNLTGFFGTIISPTLTFVVKYGSTSLITVTTSALPAGISNDVWQLNLNLTVLTTGASGTIIGNGRFQYSDAGFVTFSTPLLMTSATTIDTTASSAMDITGQWSANNAANSITTTNATMEFVN